MRSTKGDRARTRGGSILAESAISLLVLFTVFILSVLLLINTGVLIYYKIKLAMVVNETAAYAASIVVPSKLTFIHNQSVGANYAGLTAQATQYANTALQATGLSGLASSPPNVTVTYGPLAGDVIWVNVFVTVNGVPLVGNAKFLPVNFNLADSAGAVARYDQPPELHQFIVPNTTPAPPGGQDASVYMPGYGWAPGGASGDGTLDVMNLRSAGFYTTPQIIPMAIPTDGSGSLSEYEDTGSPTMTVLPGGTTNY